MLRELFAHVQNPTACILTVCFRNFQFGLHTACGIQHPCIFDLGSVLIIGEEGRKLKCDLILHSNT